MFKCVNCAFHVCWTNKDGYISHKCGIGLGHVYVGGGADCVNNKKRQSYLKKNLTKSR